MSFLIAQSLINGVILGTLYLLMAIGFTLAFGVMRIVNFAHGALLIRLSFRVSSSVIRKSFVGKNVPDGLLIERVIRQVSE